MKPTIFVSMPKGSVRDTFIDEKLISRINSLGEVRWNDSEQNLSEEQLAQALIDVDVCICGWGSAPFTEKVLQSANRLKLIAYTGASVAMIVSDALYERGVKICSGNEVFARSVAEGVVAYSLLALRRLPHYMQVMKEKGWREDVFFNEGLLDQSVGLIGFGAIARHTVEMLKPFNVDIKVYSSHMTEQDAKKYGVKLADIAEICSSCKVISVHSAATPKTYHLLSKDYLRLIPKGAVLVNTARGTVIDEDALIEELKDGRFQAVLDVFEEEPLPLNSGLRDLPNAFLIPHMGGPTLDQRLRVTESLLEDIVALYQDKPLKNEITPAASQRMSSK